jgi:hypothetical protein
MYYGAKDRKQAVFNQILKKQKTIANESKPEMN